MREEKTFHEQETPEKGTLPHKEEDETVREAENPVKDEAEQKAERLFAALNEIDDAWVEEASGEVPPKISAEKRKKRLFSRRLAALAACFCAAFLAYAAWRIYTPEKSTVTRETGSDLDSQEEAAAEQEEPDANVRLPDHGETMAAEDEDTTAASAGYDSLTDLFSAVLTELWEADPALNDGVTWAVLDLADFPEEGIAALTAEEQEFLADCLSDAFGVTVTLTSSGEYTAEEAVTDPEGIALRLTYTGSTGDSAFTFSARKIAGGDGAIYFEECEAEMEDGLWTWEAGGFSIS